MATEMSLTQVPLTLIVAATSKNGIGKNGGLPWPMLKVDMAYFARVTKRVSLPKESDPTQSDASKEASLREDRRNVVIMGRKTWDSIPPKFRPLKDRTNIVISSQDRAHLQPIPDDVVVASDILSGLRSLEQAVKDNKALPVGRAYVIGGSSIYKAAIDLPQARHILLTRISKDFDCDTYFPESLNDVSESNASGWRRRSHAELQEFVGEDVEDGPIIQHVDGDEFTIEFQLHELISTSTESQSLGRRAT